uniref:N-alpha-acetyltransferase 30 n=1 Tax=Eptatretus burgeri TaxID=7764 RepID=A0A8C4WWF3_EPTBU
MAGTRAAEAPALGELRSSAKRSKDESEARFLPPPIHPSALPLHDHSEPVVRSKHNNASPATCACKDRRRRRGINGCVVSGTWTQGDVLLPVTPSGAFLQRPLEVSKRSEQSPSEAEVPDGTHCEETSVRTGHASHSLTDLPSDDSDNVGAPEGVQLSRVLGDMSLRDPCANEDGKHLATVYYIGYSSELQMPHIMRLITKDLSEPYSIYTYRYFIHNWPQLCFLAMAGLECVGAIVCKLDTHKKMVRRGYIAMLAVDSKYRKRGIGTNLVKKAINAMVKGDCDEVVLETEVTNKSALRLYENLGFVRDKRLFRYYLNGVDALRLKLWLR